MQATILAGTTSIVTRSRVAPIKEKSMSDNLQDRGPQDRSRINVHEEWELRYWTKELGLSADELRQAVAAAGPSVKAVREHLGKPA
jgi:hypothetical protein